jgi:two-component system cell cycle response regulator
MQPKDDLARPRAMVLVVDDDEATREGLRELLSPTYLVECAADGATALEIARECHPDLVVMDVYMPGNDGFTAFERMRKETRTEDIPVIFFSGPSTEVTVRCLELGAADFMAKPVSPRELMARIDRAIREQRDRKALQSLAQTDALTGLANYRALSGRVEAEFHRALRYGSPLSMVTIDLDHLKGINDRWGHEAGNRAIVALARQLQANLRESDFAARFGGDEFVVLLPHQAPHEARVFAERLRTSLKNVDLRAPENPDDRLPLSISVGIAGHFRSSPKANFGELIKAADAALYEAKRRGRDQVVLFESDLESERPPLAQQHA